MIKKPKVLSNVTENKNANNAKSQANNKVSTPKVTKPRSQGNIIQQTDTHGGYTETKTAQTKNTSSIIKRALPQNKNVEQTDTHGGYTNTQTTKPETKKENIFTKADNFLRNLADGYNYSNVGHTGNSLNIDTQKIKESNETAAHRTTEDLMNGGTSYGHKATEIVESYLGGKTNVELKGFDDAGQPIYETTFERKGYKLDDEDLEKLPTVTIDKRTGQQADMDYYDSLYNSVQNRDSALAHSLDKLKADKQNGLISDEEYLAASQQIEKDQTENNARAQELENYQVLTGKDTYDWLLKNGSEEDIKKYEAYVGSFDDSYVESLSNEEQAILVDMMNRPIQVYDMVKMAIDQDVNRDNPTFDVRDENNISTKLQNYSNELRSYTLNGVNDSGVRNYSQQTLFSIMPMLNDTILGNIVGTVAGINDAVQMAKFAGTFANIEMGLGSANETFRRRLDEGNTFETSFYNGIAHGVVTAIVEWFNMGNVANVTNLLSGIGSNAYGVGLLSLPNIVEMAYQSHVDGKGEAVEEFLETTIDNYVDMFMSSVTGEKIANDGWYFGGIGEGGLTDQMIMAYMGSYVLSAPGNVNTVVDSYKKYKASGEARTYWANTAEFYRASGDLKNAQECENIVKIIDQERKTYADNTQIQGKIELESDQVSPAPSVEEVMNTVANLFKLDVDENFANYEQNLEQLKSLRKELNNSFAERRISMPTEDFVNMPVEERQDFLKRSREISEAFPNASVTYDASVGENAVVFKYENGDPVICVNPKGDTSVVVSALHEAVHTIENADEYSELFNTVFPTIEDFQKKFNELSEGRYSGENFDTVKKEALTVALTEDLLGDEGSEKFIEHMAKYNTSTAYKMFYNLKEATGLFRDDSKTGRLMSLMTNALANQDAVYVADGVAFSRKYNYDSRPQLTDYINEYKRNGDKAYLHGTTRMSPISRIGKYKWMPDSISASPILFQRAAIDGILTGKKQNGHNKHNRVDENIIVNLDYLMDNPLAVFESKTVPGAYTVILNARDTQGYPIIASVNPSENAQWKMNYYDVDFNKSFDYSSLTTGLYGKSKFEYIIGKDGNKYLTKDGAQSFNNFFKGFSDPIYPAGQTKSDVINSVGRLLLSTSPETSLDSSINEYLKKSRQLDVIYYANPTIDESRAGIENISDIQTYAEATSDPDELFTAADYTKEDIKKALDNGVVTVYSSQPIEAGSFVTPSKLEAQDYDESKHVNSKMVRTGNVAWIDSLEGQYAPVEPEIQFSRRNKADRSKYTNWSENTIPATLDETVNYNVEGKSVAELSDMAERIRHLIADDVERVRSAKQFTLDAISDDTRKALNKLDEIAKSIPKTLIDDSPERQQYRKELLDDAKEKFFISKNIPKDRKAYIVLGTSASGKSSFIRDYLKADAGLVDSDEFKFATKEFKENGGIVSDALHAESDMLAKQLRDDAIKEGYNIVLPLVGRNTQKIQDLVSELQKEGYYVSISCTSIPAEKAQYRALNRFIEDDRYLRYDYMQRIDGSPINTYNTVKEMEGVIDDGLWNTDVEFKAPYERIGTNGVIPERISESEEAPSGLVGIRNSGGNELYSNGRISESNGSFFDGSDTHLTSDELSDNLSTEVNDEFRELQRESERVLNESNWGSERQKRYLENADVRGRFSDVLKRTLESRGYSSSNSDGLLKDTGEYKIFKDVDGQTFHDIFNTVRNVLPYGELVDVHPVETMQHDGWTEKGYKDTRNFLSDDGMSGFSITKDGDLISVFNASGKKGFLRSAAPFIRENAKTLDCYVLDPKISGTNLQEMYQRAFGFEIDRIEDYNWDYDHDGIGNRYSEPKIAYMYNPNYAGSDTQTNNVPPHIEGEVVDGYGEERTQRFASSNIPKSQIFNEEQHEQVRQEVANGGFTYVGLTNKFEVQRAREYMQRDGIDATYDSFIQNDKPDARSVVQGEVLLQELAKNNDERWHDVAVKLADDATMAGQFLQAYAIMQRLTPQGQLMAVQRNLNRLQRNLDERFGNKAPRLELNHELEEDLKNAQTAEEAERARDALYKDLTDQVPKTFRDAINSWRYLAMLGNPRTHIRNMIGNGVFVPAVTIKNAIGTVLESALGNKLEYKTKAVLNRFSEADQKLLEAGRIAYEEYKGAIEKSQKYENTEGFNTKTKLGRILNFLAEKNSLLLDKEDYFFSKARYASSYAQFLKANGLTEETLTPEMARRANEYALLEAEKATYRDANSVAELLNKINNSNKPGLKMASYIKDAIIPFTKTPMNIVKRGVEYSPIGLIKSITYGSKQLADGKITANQYIDGMASGLTGTGIALLGALLRSIGLFRTKDDDKDRKQYFDSENGEQDYAIDLSPFGINGTYTIDWATPVIMPFAIGAELYDAFSNLEGVDGFKGTMNAVADVSAKAMDPIMETSMLSSLQDALKSYSTSGGEWMGDMIVSMASSYVQQMFPTLGGQIARTIDDTRRTTYPNSGSVDKTIKQIYNKIPWLSKLNQPYINRQGQEEKTEDLGMGWAGRMLLNMVSPGYYSSKDIDKYDEELYRLYESTTSLDAFPSSTSKSVSIDGEDMKFTPEEYTQWHKTRWQTETEYVNQFIDSQAYKNLSDEERVATIEDIRTYAQKVAKKQFLESKGYTYTDDKDLAEENPGKYVYDKQLTNASGAVDNGIELYSYYDYLNNAGTKQAEKIAYLEESGLSQEQKEYLYGLEGYKTSYAAAYAKAFGKSYSSSSSSKKKSSKKKSSGGRGRSSGGRSKSSARTTAPTFGVSVSNSSSKGTVSKANLTSNRSSTNYKVPSSYLSSYSSSMGSGGSSRQSVSTSSSRTVVCPNCGNRVFNSSGRCPICGARL